MDHFAVTSGRGTARCEAADGRVNRLLQLLGKCVIVGDSAFEQQVFLELFGHFALDYLAKSCYCHCPNLIVSPIWSSSDTLTSSSRHFVPAPAETAHGTTRPAGQGLQIKR